MNWSIFLINNSYDESNPVYFSFYNEKTVPKFQITIIVAGLTEILVA